MGLQLPYKRIVRQLKDNSYKNKGNGRYIEHPDYAETPHQYIRAFLLLQKDLHALFDFIEPADLNLKTFSYRVHELLIRTCIEIEANFKAILTENGYVKTNKKGGNLDFNIKDYRKINKSHKLSSYEITIPNWIGDKGIIKPFEKWDLEDTLPWYKAYNETKHNRHNSFHIANFKNLIDATCALVALLSSQFMTGDFSSIKPIGARVNNGDGFTNAIGGFFRVKFPMDWSDDEKYDFDWEQLTNKEILAYNYNKK